MGNDEWSSLDEDESDSFIASSGTGSSDDSSDNSSDDGSSPSSDSGNDRRRKKSETGGPRSTGKTKAVAVSSSESDVGPKSRRKSAGLSTRAVSTRSSTPSAPVSGAKSTRKAVLDSLAKKRRLSKVQYRDEPDFIESGDSLSDSSRDFVVSGSESSEGEMDPGFYARVSQMMDRKSEKSQSISDSMSPRSAFLLMLKYYAIRFVSPGMRFPVATKKFKKQLPSFEAATRKIERDLEARRDITKPSYWRPDSPHVVLMNAYPDYRRSPFSHDPDQLCDACNKRGRLAATLTLRGRKYNSAKLWKESDLKSWLRAHRLSLLVKDESGTSSSDSDSSSDEGWVGFEGPTLTCGDTCFKNVQVYHKLQHSKHHILFRLYHWISNQRLAGSADRVVEELEFQKDGIVEQWFENYLELTTLSERNCDTFTDVLGGFSPAPAAKRIPSESKRRKSFRF